MNKSDLKRKTDQLSKKFHRNMMSMFFNSGTTDHVAILELHGEIGKNLSLDVAKSLIDETFRIDGLKAMLLEIDSPDGSSFEFFLVLLSHNYVMM